MSARDDFHPTIVGFLCNWCSYAGADLAGTSRINYPDNLRVIRVMCSGRVDPLFVMEAFLGGADGVMVLGCHPGDCHYISGNLMAERKMEMVSALLEVLGLGGDRLLLDWVSASEGERFAGMVTDFTKKILELGPITGKKLAREELLRHLEVARDTVEEDRLRWLVGRAHELIESGDAFGDRLEEEHYRELMLDLLEEEVLGNQVLSATEQEAQTVTEISLMIGVEPPRVFRAVLALVDEGKLAEAGREGFSPLYRITNIPLEVSE